MSLDEKKKTESQEKDKALEKAGKTKPPVGGFYKGGGTSKGKVSKSTGRKGKGRGKGKKGKKGKKDDEK